MESFHVKGHVSKGEDSSLPVEINLNIRVDKLASLQHTADREDEETTTPMYETRKNGIITTSNPITKLWELIHVETINGYYKK